MLRGTSVTIDSPKQKQCHVVAITY